jgi:Spy/CpxP family protein refolding chaperone
MIGFRHMSRARKASLTAASILLLVGGVGVLAGVTLERELLDRDGGAAAAYAAPPPPPDSARRDEGGDTRRGGGGPGHGRDAERRHRFLDHLSRELALTPTQRATIDTLLASEAREIDSVMATVRPRMEGIVRRTRGTIDSLLTAEQRVKFDSLRAKRRGMRGGGRGPSPSR